MQQHTSDYTEGNQVSLQAEQILHASRTGDYAAGASMLNRFLASLQKELSRGTVPVKTLSAITYSLETLSQMQQMGNWVAFADLLEYEFLPLWQNALTTTHR